MKILKGSIKSIEILEITKSELLLLERSHSHKKMSLNISILIPTSITIILGILNGHIYIENEMAKYLLLISGVFVITYYVMNIFKLKKEKNDIDQLLKEIKERIPADSNVLMSMTPIRSPEHKH